MASGASPVLARLPDVSAELPATKSTAQPAAHKPGYRFDPPMPSTRAARPAEDEQTKPFRTLKSELVYAPHSTRPLHPHVFEKSWMKPIKSRLQQRRESPILPRSNPFAIPRRSMLETLSPFLHFLTMAALFTAAGTWIQLNRHDKQREPAKAPETAIERSDAAPTKTVDRPINAPTAIGPVSSAPETGRRAGHQRPVENYATLSVEIRTVGAAELTTVPAPASSGAYSANGALSSQMPSFETPAGPEIRRAPEVASRPYYPNQIPSR